jgi:hypothetical protein
MAVGIGVVLIALGATLTWGATGAVAGVSLSTVGIVLMVFGTVGLVAAVLYSPASSDRRRAERLGLDR